MEKYSFCVFFYSGKKIGRAVNLVQICNMVSYSYIYIDIYIFIYILHIYVYKYTYMYIYIYMLFIYIYIDVSAPRLCSSGHQRISEGKKPRNRNRTLARPVSLYVTVFKICLYELPKFPFFMYFNGNICA